MRSKEVIVDNIKFDSARAAARYIVKMEAEDGIKRKENTIAKELKRTWKGSTWLMYDKYLVLAPVEPLGSEGSVTV